MIEFLRCRFILLPCISAVAGTAYSNAVPSATPENAAPLSTAATVAISAVSLVLVVTVVAIILRIISNIKKVKRTYRDEDNGK